MMRCSVSIFKATSKNVIPAKAGIQKSLTTLACRLRGIDKLVIIRSTLKSDAETSTHFHICKVLFFNCVPMTVHPVL